MVTYFRNYLNKYDVQNGGTKLMFDTWIRTPYALSTNADFFMNAFGGREGERERWGGGEESNASIYIPS